MVTRDDVLRTFHNEINICKEDLEKTESEALRLRLMGLSNPIIFDGRLDELWIHKIVIEERLQALERSRDRLVEVMAEECL